VNYPRFRYRAILKSTTRHTGSIPWNPGVLLWLLPRFRNYTLQTIASVCSAFSKISVYLYRIFKLQRIRQLVGIEQVARRYVQLCAQEDRQSSGFKMWPRILLFCCNAKPRFLWHTWNFSSGEVPVIVNNMPWSVVRVPTRYWRSIEFQNRIPRPWKSIEIGESTREVLKKYGNSKRKRNWSIWA